MAGEAYINVYHVEMFPDRVTFAGRRAVNLRSVVGVSAPPVDKVDLNGEYKVLGAARAERGEPWYRIAAGGREGWVAGRLVDRRSYLFDSVHLVAGLYRYAHGQFGQAEHELESFLADAKDEDNVTRSVARQFLAASRIAGRRGVGRNVNTALDDLQQAVALTPFDPASYRMRAVVRLGAKDLESAIADLDHALSLDRTDPGSQRLLTEMLSTLQGQKLRLLSPGTDVRQAEQALRQLETRYRSR